MFDFEFVDWYNSKYGRKPIQSNDTDLRIYEGFNFGFQEGKEIGYGNGYDDASKDAEVDKTW